MNKLAGIASALVLGLAALPALAQVKAPDPTDAKFAAADADKSGSLEGKELDSYKAVLDKMDTDKNGKVTRQEFDVAVKTGLVK